MRTRAYHGDQNDQPKRTTSVGEALRRHLRNVKVQTAGKTTNG